MPLTSRQATSPRLVTYQSRSPSTNGVEQTPSRGQSLATGSSILSLTCCQRNLPVASSKHISTPLSTGIGLPVRTSVRSGLVSRGLRGRSLLVPTKILPPAITGPADARLPSSAFRGKSPPSATGRTSHFAARPVFPMLTMLRVGPPPKQIQSARRGGELSACGAGELAGQGGGGQGRCRRRRNGPALRSEML